MKRVVVIGAGIVGVTTAVKLQVAGYQVTVVDAEGPAEGCSYGNAGIIANSFILPLSSPGHILSAPRLLIDRRGPLAIRFRDLLSIAPWLLRFAANALPRRQRQTITGLKALNAAALPSWRALLGQVGCEGWLRERGMIELARTQGALPRLRASAARLRNEGLPISELTAEDIAELEPILADRAPGGLLHEGVAHVSEPYRLALALAERFREAGGIFARDTVRSVVPSAGSAIAVGLRRNYSADHIVVAAGHGSAGLLAPLGAKVPIGIEYGYHLMASSSSAGPTRPLSFSAEGFVATPLDGGLRLAGTVELAKPGAGPDWRRARHLAAKARHYLPGLEIRDGAEWRGGRPSFPDGLPAIGRLARSPRLIYAFGHQHLGLTQAAITADMVLALVAERLPTVDPLLYALDRFG